MAINKILNLIRPCFIVTMSHACVYTICERSYFFDLWSIVLNDFSFPTLLARATYMSYGGGGGVGEKSNGLVSTPCSPPPPMGWGRGGGRRGPIFRLIPPVTNTLWFEYYLSPYIISDIRLSNFFSKVVFINTFFITP